MKKILAIAVIVITSLSSAQAQEGIRLGAKGSFFSTWLFNKNVSDQNASLDYASTFSPSFGIQAIFMLKETYGISAEIVYASHKQKYDGYLNNENNTFTNEINLSYIDIPILFRVSSDKGPYFEVGPQVSLLTGAKETFEFANSTTDNYSDRDVKDDFVGFGVAGVLGFGIDIKLTDMINLTTGLRFGYMFTDATTEYTKEEFEKIDPDKGSVVSFASHYEAENQIGSNKNDFSYQKSNRAFGGLQIGIQFMLDK